MQTNKWRQQKQKQHNSCIQISERNNVLIVSLWPGVRIVEKENALIIWWRTILLKNIGMNFHWWFLTQLQCAYVFVCAKVALSVSVSLPTVWFVRCDRIILKIRSRFTIRCARVRARLLFISNELASGVCKRIQSHASCSFVECDTDFSGLHYVKKMWFSQFFNNHRPMSNYCNTWLGRSFYCLRAMRTQVHVHSPCLLFMRSMIFLVDRLAYIHMQIPSFAYMNYEARGREGRASNAIVFVIAFIAQIYRHFEIDDGVYSRVFLIYSEHFFLSSFFLLLWRAVFLRRVFVANQSHCDQTCSLFPLPSQ